MEALPRGIQDFETLRKRNYYYVDKTKFIETLENNCVGCQMSLHPKRFRKSLLISMLENYREINKTNNFEELFKETCIYDNPTLLKNSCYVLENTD